MADVREATEEFLADKPELEGALRELVEVDTKGPWEFDEVPLDSGNFGEIVSRGIVERRDDGYRVTDPAAVQAVLDGETESISTTDDAGLPSVAPSFPSISTTDRRLILMLTGAVLLVIVFRLISYPAVFRNGDVVLSGNDPYFYRFWVERVASQAATPFDFSALSKFPGGVAKGEPLLVTTLWWGASLLGGGKHTIGVVLAWYPVVSAVFTALIVYVLGTRLFEDARVGVASVVMLAVIPVHAFRAGLGFADHHAFDYFWLMVTVLALVMLAERSGRDGLRSQGTWASAGLLGIAVAGQALAWDNSPILISVIGAYVAIRVLSDVRAEASPIIEHAPLMVGLTLATTITHLAHTGFGWHTDQVAYAPAFVLVGIVGITILAEFVYRLSLPTTALAGGEVVGAIVGWFGLQTVLPTYAQRLTERTGFLFTTQEVVEAASLFGSQMGTIIGPIVVFGFVFVLGLPYLVWGCWRAYHEHRPSWLVLGVYGWYFLGFSVIQIRFAGELGPVIAVFAGLGFVHLASNIDVVDAPRIFDTESSRVSNEGGVPSIGFPSVGSVFYLGVLFLLVGSFGFVQTPVITSQVTIDDPEYRAAKWMAADAEQRDWDYPQNYVLSEWGHNRMYNYFVNGQSQSYGFAQSTYVPFLESNNGSEWYTELKGRVGYIVTQDGFQTGQNTNRFLYTRLHTNYGSRANGISGLAHYRAVFATHDGTVKVFILVPGATIIGNEMGDSSLRVSTQVEIRGTQFDYERQIDRDLNGNFTVTVPYPGEYVIGDQRVTVSAEAVMNGAVVEL